MSRGGEKIWIFFIVLPRENNVHIFESPYNTDDLVFNNETMFI